MIVYSVKIGNQTLYFYKFGKSINMTSDKNWSVIRTKE